MTHIRTILHPTDFSKQSEFAFQLACSLARDYGADLYVLHVMPLPVVAYIEGPLPIASEALQEELRQKLDRLHAENGKVRVLHRLVEGEPVNEILNMALETSSDLIIIGTHGRTGVGRMLMGSVAEGVSRKAPCPVLTVKNPFPEATEESRQKFERIPTAAAMA